MTGTVKTRKEELTAVLERARAEMYEIEDAETIARCEPLIGKHFKYRNNYSCPETEADYWWLYLRVVKMKDHRLLCIRFQTDKYGRIEIQPDESLSDRAITGSNYVPISATEFKRAWTAMTNRILKLGDVAVPLK